MDERNVKFKQKNCLCTNSINSGGGCNEAPSVAMPFVTVLNT